MALIDCSFFSESLGLSTAMTVILPQGTSAGQIGMGGKVGQTEGHGHPTMYLLHGLSDDHTIWLRRTSIERYVAPLGIAVVMPAVHRSFYADMKYGGKYWEFVSEEVPRVAREFFRLSSRREDNLVAGLSMGGYGAFKMALNCPESFCAGASLSGALRLDLGRRYDAPEDPLNKDILLTVGPLKEFTGSINDLSHALTRFADEAVPKPRLYQCCGDQDFLLEQNRAFVKDIDGRGFDFTYEEDSGHSHEWGYWDLKIQRVLEWWRGASA